MQRLFKGLWPNASAARSAWLRFLIVAAALSAIKIVLYSIGTTLFLAREGVNSLPAFYILLALVAILISTWLGSIVDRVPRPLLFRAFILLTATSVLTLRLAIVGDLSGVYYAALISAHVFDIASDIIFWVLASARFDNLELKRSTAHFYVAIAAGGAAAGLAVDQLTGWIAADDILLLLPILAFIALFAMRGETTAFTQADLGEHPGEEESEDGPLTTLMALPGLIGRHPFILLLAINSLLLTVVYGLTEYAVFAVYSEAYAEEAALAGFLAMIFAAIQILELTVLLSASGTVVARLGPVVRNLVFPISSLACLLALLAGQRLPAAILAHLNTEAVSNAIFEPVNASNYTALPPAVHGRARTVADGIFYPAGLAMAGLGIAMLEQDAAVYLAIVLALVACVLFVLTNAGIGYYFLSTLIRSLRSGVADVTRSHPRPTVSTPPSAAELLALFEHGNAADRAAGLDLLPDLPAAAFIEALPRLASAIEAEERGRLARLCARQSVWPELRTIDATDPALAEILLRARLIRGETDRVTTSVPAGPVDQALTEMVGTPPDREPSQTPWLASPAAAEAVLETAAASGLNTYLPAVLLVLEYGPSSLRALALDTALGLGGSSDPRVQARAEEAIRSDDVALRCAGLKTLAASQNRAALQNRNEAALRAGLDDAAGEVRRCAAQLMAGLGDDALPVLEARLQQPGHAGRLAALEALGFLGSSGARRVLKAFLERLAGASAANQKLHRHLPPETGGLGTQALEIALADSDGRVLELVFETLTALGETPRTPQLCQVLRSISRRDRAAAIDGFLSFRHRRLLRPFLPLFEATFLERVPWPKPPHQAITLGPVSPALLEAARAHHDPWVRAAADLPATPELAPPELSSGAERSPILEQLLLLKRHALLRHLPLDTLKAVSGVLDTRRFAAGARILTAGQRLDHLWLVASGSILVARSDGSTDRLVAGDQFGETALADELTPAPAVTAETDCEVLRLHRIVFQDLAREHPSLSVELCHLLALRLRRHEAGDTTGTPVLAG